MTISLFLMAMGNAYADGIGIGSGLNGLQLEYNYDVKDNLTIRPYINYMEMSEDIKVVKSKLMAKLI